MPSLVQTLDFNPFAHLTAPNAALYRRVMGEFVAAKRRFVVHLRLEDIREAVLRDPSDRQIAAEAIADPLAFPLQASRLLHESEVRSEDPRLLVGFLGQSSPADAAGEPR